MLAIGMPYDLYWHGELEAVEYYLNSLKYRDMRANQDFHLQGVYFLKALQEVLQFTTSPVEIYPRKPIELGARSEPTQEEVVNEMKAQFEQIRAKLGDRANG